MRTLTKVLVGGFVGLTITAGARSAIAQGGKPLSARDDVVSVTTDADNEVTEISVDELLDYNELTHLIFMREEEKLARDVYTTLGTMYPDSVIFGNIDDSEQRHMTTVKNMIEKYGYEYPNTNDNVGKFTGAGAGPG